MSDVHKFLKELRLKRRMTLRDAAVKSGLSHSYISSLEQGKHPKTKAPINPSPESLERLAVAYNYPYEELMKLAGYIKETKNPVEKLIEYLETDLTNEEIRERMTFRIDGMILSEEDVDEFIAFVRAKRFMKKQPASAAKSEDS